jgi:YqaJ-like viral recombinase domain
MSAKYYCELIQNSPEWRDRRCGMLTASEMKFILTPKLKIAENDYSRSHLAELLAQRITKFVEPHYILDDMLRGHDDEVEALKVYQNYGGAQTASCGFITNDKWGFVLGYSPDALVGDTGLFECKSRRQKFQIQTILHHHLTGEIPADFLIQVQSGLLVADDREWIDLGSYSGGLPMRVMRVYPDEPVQSAILTAARDFEIKMDLNMGIYRAAIESSVGGNCPTERMDREMFV